MREINIYETLLIIFMQGINTNAFYICINISQDRILYAFEIYKRVSVGYLKLLN